jgi:tetratricopeptide (TPR) repeat protein
LSQGPFIEDPTDEDYASAARAALSAKDHRLALEQAAAAASLRPLHEPHVKLLDEAIAATKGPLQALELKPGGTFFGVVAARARALARLDRTGEALDCLFKATTFSPKTTFLPWGVPWVAHAREVRRVDPKALALSILELVQVGAAVVNLEAAEAIATKVAATAGDGDGALVVARSRILRALGRHEDALALLAGRADWGSIVERGAVHRDRNELEERVRCFEETDLGGGPRGTTPFVLRDAAVIAPLS